MKKLICLMLAALLALGCAGGFAEGQDENEKTAFLQIKEGITAKVFEAAGDTEEIDTLESGRFCGLIEEAEEGETLWFHVFYLDSEKKGATGYILAEEADQLTWKDLKELMEDPQKVNEILDMIDALNDYLNPGKTAAAAEGEGQASGAGNGTNAGGTDSKAGKNRIQQFYNEAMDAIQQVFKTDLSKEWKKAEDKAKETAENLAEAGQDAWNSVKDGAKDLFNKAKEKGKETLDQAVEDAGEMFSKAGETIGKELEENAPELKEKLDKAADAISDAVESVKDGTAKEKLEDLAEDAAGAVSDVVESVKDGTAKEKLKDLADDVLDDVSDALDTLKDGTAKDKTDDPEDEASDEAEKLPDNPAQELYNNLVDKVMDTIEILKDDSTEDNLDALKDSVEEFMDALDKSVGNGAGETLDKVNKLADDARELLSSMEFTMAQYAVTGLANLFREEGFTQGVQATSNLIQLLAQLNNQ